MATYLARSVAQNDYTRENGLDPMISYVRITKTGNYTGTGDPAKAATFSTKSEAQDAAREAKSRLERRLGARGLAAEKRHGFERKWDVVTVPVKKPRKRSLVKKRSDTDARARIAREQAAIKKLMSKS